MRYYDLKRNWGKIVPHLKDNTLNEILVEDFNKFTFGHWAKEFKPGELPRDYETCFWGVEHRGPEPAFWRYVKHGACHWLVNFNLLLAQLVAPQKQWRIITSEEHSTVWDGRGLLADPRPGTLFDFNSLALLVPPAECFEMAYHGENAEVLPAGEYLSVPFAAHYTEDKKPQDLTEDDADNFRRQMRGIRDYYNYCQMTDEMIDDLTRNTIPKFYEFTQQGGDIAEYWSQQR